LLRFQAIATAGNVEVDENRQKDGEKNDPMGRFSLLLTMQKVLTSIIKSEALVPFQFRFIFAHLQVSFHVASRFPRTPVK